ncbi:MAG: glycosyltransferase [Pseudomonadota bacterium]|nr:glycosyltransferase [Pseudomonadota bacterium]
MKLLYTNFHDGDGGGHTTYIRTLAGALAGRHEVHVAAPAGSRLVREARSLKGVRVWEQPFPNGLNRLAARARARAQLKDCLVDEKFDIVHVNGSADHRLVLSVVRHLSRKPRVVLTKHNSKPIRGLGHWWRARHTDQVIAVCDYTYRALSQTAYRRCALATVPNGIDTHYYAPQREVADGSWYASGDWRKPDALLLGSTSGTAAYKGWMDLIEALALLPASLRGQIHLLIAGRLPETSFRERIAALKLTDQIHFAGLMTDVRPAIAAMDVGFVLSWDVETISFACREMMAMGKPVVVTEYAGLPENIRPGLDGWCVPPRDTMAMATLLEQLLEQRDALPAMGQQARRHAEQSFGLQRFVDGTERVYRDLLQHN